MSIAAILQSRQDRQVGRSSLYLFALHSTRWASPWPLRLPLHQYLLFNESNRLEINRSIEAVNVEPVLQNNFCFLH